MFSLRTFLLFLWLSPTLLAQEVYRASNRFGSTTGDCIAKVKDNKIYKTSGAFCYEDACTYILEQNLVFESRGSFCTIKGNCKYIFQEGIFYKSADAFGHFLGDIVFIVQGNRVYEARNNFGRGDCLFIIEGNKVYNSSNSFGSIKDDCLLVIKGENISLFAILTILARRF